MHFYIYPTCIGTEYFKHGTTEDLVAATRDIGLEISADKTKYLVKSRVQNAGRIHSVRMNKCTFENVEVFKYLGTNLTN